MSKKIYDLLLIHFGKNYRYLTRENIIEFLTRFDTLENIKKMYGMLLVVKIIYNLVDDKPVTEFNSMMMRNRKMIRNKILADKSRNYIDHITTFKFIEDNPIYDLVIEVNYVSIYG